MSASKSSTSKYIRNDEGNYVCPNCPKITQHQNTMYYHIKKEHTKDLPFECKLCVALPRFLQKSSYLHHLATLHPEMPDDDTGCKNPYAGVTYACPSCDHISHTKSNTRIHYARNHAKDWIPTYTKDPCGSCGKECASSSSYLYHAIDCFPVPEDHKSILSRIK